MKPAIARLEDEVERNRDRLVTTVVNLEEFEHFDKGNQRQLDDFLASDEVDGIKSDRRPLALRKVVRANKLYDRYVIDYYIRRLSEEFPDQFRYVLLLDRDETFLALIATAEFQRGLDDEVMTLLRSGREEFTTAQARALLAERFGLDAVSAISASARAGTVLANTPWRRPDQLHPVVDGSGQLIGLTSLNQILDGVLG